VYLKKSQAVAISEKRKIYDAKAMLVNGRVGKVRAFSHLYIQRDGCAEQKRYEEALSGNGQCS
jgi:hypothetical protein